MKTKFKSEKGVTGMDIASGLIIFVLTSTVVIGIYYQIYMNTIATKVHQVLIGCITEIFERIDLEDYATITEGNIKGWPEYTNLTNIFNEEKNESTVKCTVTNYTTETGADYDLVRKVKITVDYTVGGHHITYPIEKVKVKELSK